ncbi:MAG: RIP metalloprotease RseP [Gemmatimonadales bacterium]
MLGNVAFTIVVLAIVLGVLIFVHELGHYLACKAFGVWVHRFSIGFGRPIERLTFHRGETEWAVSWLPLGGYVKMASREEAPSAAVLEGGAANEHVPPDRVFEAKPVWQRMVILVAGVTLNLVFAFVVFTGLAWKNGRQYDPITTVGRVMVPLLPRGTDSVASIAPGARITAIDGHQVHSWDDIVERIATGDRDSITFAFADRTPLVVPMRRDALEQRTNLASALEPREPPVIGVIGAGTAASSAGFAVGDSIIAVNGAPIRWWADAVEQIQPAAGRPVEIEVQRGTERRTITVTPREEHLLPDDPSTPMIGRIGVGAMVHLRSESLGPIGAIRAGANACYSSAGLIFRTLRGIANGSVAVKTLGGPILVGQMAADEARQGLDNLLAFMALISVNLAVVNLLPIPVLDGGAVLMLAIEGLIRRPIPPRLREAFAVVGLALVVLLMVIAFRNDILRLLGK